MTTKTYTILETKIRESRYEQTELQSVDIADVIRQSSDIKGLIETLNDAIEDEPVVYSNS